MTTTSIPASRSTPRARAAIIGASGYTGVELMRLCAQHPHLDLVYATGDTQAGTRAAALYPSLSAAASAIAGTRWNGPRFFGLRGKG